MQVVFALLDARRRRDLDAVTALLDPDVVHQGVTDELVCHDREQVLQNVRGSFESEHDSIDHLELLGAGDRVVLGLAGPRFRDVPWAPLVGQLFVVHTVRDGLVVHMQDFLTRADALAEAGASPTAWA
jgi:ketosteroid isomerase-like protein